MSGREFGGSRYSQQSAICVKKMIDETRCRSRKGFLVTSAQKGRRNEKICESCVWQETAPSWGPREGAMTRQKAAGRVN